MNCFPTGATLSDVADLSTLPGIDTDTSDNGTDVLAPAPSFNLTDCRFAVRWPPGLNDGMEQPKAVINIANASGPYNIQERVGPSFRLPQVSRHLGSRVKHIQALAVLQQALRKTIADNVTWTVQSQPECEEAFQGTRPRG
jgi:hypothetical protein